MTMDDDDDENEDVDDGVATVSLICFSFLTPIGQNNYYRHFH